MKTLAAWVITAVWVALYIRKLYDPSFPVPAEVTPVMLLAAGYLFGRDVKEKLRERVDRALEGPRANDDQQASDRRNPTEVNQRGRKRDLPRAKDR